MLDRRDRLGWGVARLRRCVRHDTQTRRAHGFAGSEGIGSRRAALSTVVVPFNRFAQLARADHDGTNFYPRSKTEIIKHSEIRRIFHAQVELTVRSVVLQEERDHTMLRRKSRGHKSDHFRQNSLAGETRDRQIELLRERADQVALFDHTHLDERYAKTFSPSRLLSERGSQLHFINDAGGDKDLSNPRSISHGSPLRTAIDKFSEQHEAQVPGT